MTDSQIGLNGAAGETVAASAARGVDAAKGNEERRSDTSFHSTPDPVGEGERWTIYVCAECPAFASNPSFEATRACGRGGFHGITRSIEVVPLADLQAAHEERDRLREALEPFGKFADRLDGVWAKSHGVDPDQVGKPQWEDDEPIYDSCPIAAKNDLLVAHFREARSALTTGTAE